MGRAPLLLMAVLLVAGCGTAEEGQASQVLPSRAATADASPASGFGSGTAAELAPKDPYPSAVSYVRVAGRGQSRPADGVCASTRGPRLLAVLASGPQDDRETLSLAETTVCPEGLTSPRTVLASASWARTARSLLAAVQRSADSTDHAVLYRSGKRQPLPPVRGYSTNIPVPYDDGSVAVAVADERGMRVDLLRPDAASATLLTSPTTVAGFDFTPSGGTFVAIEKVGAPGAYTATKMTVANANGVRRHLLPRPFAANLLVLDEAQAVIGDITDRPGAASVLVDLATGGVRPLAPGLFPVAYDPPGQRLLMRDGAGALFWLRPDGGKPQPVAGVVGIRVVGGDFVR